MSPSRWAIEGFTLGNKKAKSTDTLLIPYLWSELVVQDEAPCGK